MKITEMLTNAAVEAARRFGELSEAGPRFSPEQLGDPLALKTSWAPLKGGGANFGTHKLVKTGDRRLEFRATTGAKLFCFVFSGFGLVFAAIGFAIGLGFLVSGQGSDYKVLVPPLAFVVFGLVFAAIGLVMYRFMCAPTVFDKRLGFFWKGRKSPENTFDRRSLKECVELDRIHALQLISEYCHGNKTGYYSYELNLVFTDGSRLNVVDHGNLEKLKRDAEDLSLFLGKPLWNAC